MKNSLNSKTAVLLILALMFLASSCATRSCRNTGHRKVNTLGAFRNN